MITCQEISVRVDDRLILDRVTLEIPTGETLVLLGSSGTGKSTLLRAILKLIPIEHGTITLDGADIAAMDSLALRRAVGMVFQGIALFPHLTVAGNIALPLRVIGMDRREITKRIDEVLELVGLDRATHRLRFPHQLSGGQQQRVGVARALAPRPSYLLMDEPFGALDATTRRNMQDELKRLRSHLGITIVFVTHDVMEAASLGDRIAVIDQGRMVQCGTVRELMNDAAHDAVHQLVSMPLTELQHFVTKVVR